MTDAAEIDTFVRFCHLETEGGAHEYTRLHVGAMSLKTNRSDMAPLVEDPEAEEPTIRLDHVACVSDKVLRCGRFIFVARTWWALHYSYVYGLQRKRGRWIPMSRTCTFDALRQRHFVLDIA